MWIVLIIVGLLFLFTIVAKAMRDDFTKPVDCPVCDRKFRKAGASVSCPYCKTEFVRKADGQIVNR